MRVESTEGIIEVKIKEQGKVERIGNQMEEEVKKNVTEFLHNSYDVMANNPLDMKGASRAVIKYRLNVKKKLWQ